ncbi:MAG: hypothetical protein C4547_01295 [Phycisphaerales bacterium]|nr:MAG: hypothetical protein C4547_01295 [Phycisphaerales bacterium]
MTRSAASAGSLHPDAHRTRAQTPRASARRHALEDLTAAAEIHRRFAPGERVDRVAPGVLFSLAAAVAAGAALVFAGGFEYRSIALMQLMDSSAADIGALRARLSEHVAERLPAQGARFSVETPAADLLRLNLVTPDRASGVRTARALAESFLASLESSSGRPGAREQWLQVRLEDLRSRLDAAEQRVIDSVARTSLDHPGLRQSELLSRWRRDRREFEAAREDLRTAAVAFHELQQRPPPSRASVREEARQDAIASDESLQQDLAQLKAELTELRLAVLDDWQQTAPVVDALIAQSARLREVVAAALRRTRDAGLQVELERIDLEADAYRDRATAFAQAWTQQFLVLKSLQPEPLSSALFDVVARIGTMEGEFLFHVGKPLSNLHARSRQLGGGDADTRLYVLESDVVRAFESLRDVHDRFSLLTSERPSIAIDAALRTSRRLDRRVRDALARIDERLAAEALERARREHTSALAEAQKKLEAARASYDALAARLIELQDELNVTSDLTAEFLRASLTSEFASLRLQDVVREMDKTQREVSALRSEREADAAGQRLRLRQVVADDAPANLASQLRLGGLGAVLAFLVSMLSQWRLLRKRRGPA